MTGIVDNDGGDPTQLSWWINRFLEILQTIGKDLAEFPEDPADALEDLLEDIFGPAGLIADEFTHLGEALQTFPQLAAIPLIVPGDLRGGVAGLSLVAGIQPAPAPVPPSPRRRTDGPGTQCAGRQRRSGRRDRCPGRGARAVFYPDVGPVTRPGPGRCARSATAAAVSGAEAAAFPYLVGGPGIGTGSGMGSGAQRKAPEPDAAAAAASAPASVSERQRARRQRRAAMNDHYRGYEFMDLEPDAGPEPDPGSSLASDSGAGRLGFAGTRSAGTAAATGLTTLASDEFGDGPSIPMLPNDWGSDR